MVPDAALLRVSVIGAGSWGTALAALACRQVDTVLWGRNPEQIQRIQQTGQNPAYLPGVTLPQALRATNNLPGAVSHALANGPENGLLILGVPVAGMASTCRQLADALEGLATDGLAVIWTCKGFEPDTADLPHVIVNNGLGSVPGLVTGVLSGPSFAREVAQGLPVALTVAGSHPSVAARTVAALHSQQARIYTSEDIIGVEVGGALKNVMAIACGIADGLELGTNARAALITRGLAEMQRLGMALGGRAETFAGLTGLGDLVLTATGPLSRNRQVGLLLGQGQSLQSILSGGITAEGVRCARAARRLGQQHQVDMPITEAVCEVLFEGISPPQAVARLLTRDSRPE